MRILKQEQFNIGFERRKIPRYVYHLTNEKAYNSILKDGFIKTSDKDSYTHKAGIFTIDLFNFFKFWGNHKDWDLGDNETLRKSLLRIAAKWIKTFDKKKGNLVVLKIPTSSLNPDEFSIRSQHTFFRHLFSEANTSIYSLPEREKDNITGKTLANSDFGKKLRKHEASEYIYFENIPAINIERIGQIVNINEIRENDDFKLHPVKAILQRALANTPEAKWLKNLNE